MIRRAIGLILLPVGCIMTFWSARVLLAEGVGFFGVSTGVVAVMCVTVGYRYLFNTGPRT